MVIKVGMAELKVAMNSSILKTLGLGSCVGVCVIDPVKRVGGLAHIMLPAMSEYRDKSNPAKYADTAIAMMLEEMERLYAIKSRMVAKIAGGAQMFRFSGASTIMRIGERNVAAVRQELHKHGIPIVAEDTGGSYGRTIEFSCADGSLTIKTIGKGTKVI